MDKKMMTNAQRWKAERGKNKLAPIPAVQVLDELVGLAISSVLLCSSPRDEVRHALRSGKPIPERSLPGRLVMRLSDQKRELLKDLRGEMTDNAAGFVKYYGAFMM